MKVALAHSIPRRALSVAVLAALFLTLLLSLPLGTTEVSALTYSDPPEHVYTLTGATQAAVIADLMALLHDAILHHYSRFDVVSGSTAANTYFDLALTQASVRTDLLNDYRSALNFGSDDPSTRGFDYEVGNLETTGVKASGTLGSAYAKTVNYLVGWRETQSQRQKVLDHVHAFLGSAAYPAGGTDDQKLTAINDYICNTFSYDTTFHNISAFAMIDPSSPYYGKGMCQAYALYGYLMLTEAGYPVRAILIRYDANGTECKPDATPYGSGHAWLLVKVGANWYHMDFTWNDPMGPGSTKDYFLKTDAQMRSDHRWTGPAGYYPAATTAWAGVPVSPTPSPVAIASPTPRPTSSATPTKAPTRAPRPTSTAVAAPRRPPRTTRPRHPPRRRRQRRTTRPRRPLRRPRPPRLPLRRTRRFSSPVPRTAAGRPPRSGGRRSTRSSRPGPRPSPAPRRRGPCFSRPAPPRC